jgi:hypothetical protein
MDAYASMPGLPRHERLVRSEAKLGLNMPTAKL